MKFLLSAMLMVSIPALADTWVTATVASLHYGADRSYEQQNWGVGIEQDLAKDWRAIAGHYRNSNRRDSLYFGASWTPMRWGNFGSGMAMMLVGGYETTKRPELVKAAFPFFSYESKGWGLNVPIIPKYQDNPGVIAIQIKFKW